MTVKEINVFVGRIIDLVNNFNEVKRVELGLIKGNMDIAYDTMERISITVDTLTSVLKECNVYVIIRYDLSGLVFKIDVSYHDIRKEYKANSIFRILHK